MMQLTEESVNPFDGPPARRPSATPGRRAARKLATERAMREAAVRLMTERGYDAVSTDEIARAAGVSPRTFFNYFPSKESVVFLPEPILPSMVVTALRSRPTGEDPASSVAAAAMDTFARFNQLIGLGAAGLMRAQLRLMLTEPELRRITFERRMRVEDAAWTALRERGVAAEDLAAHAAVTTVVSLTFLALVMWATSDDEEPLVAVLARCLLAAPHPARLATGTTAAPSVG